MCTLERSLYERKRNAEKKLTVLTHYGKQGKLRCCWRGCSVVDIDMLTIDHVNNDGAAHRKILAKGKPHRGGVPIYHWLIHQKFPDGYQTLCQNHQLKKELMRQRREFKHGMK